MANDNTALEKAIQALRDGSLQSDDIEVISRTAQLQMSCSIVSLIANIQKNLQRLDRLSEAAVNKYVERLRTQIDSDIISNQDLFQFVTDYQKNQLQIVDLYRKIVQSPNQLFSDSGLTDDERKVVRLFNSFRTAEERTQFMEVVERELNGNN